LALLPIYTYGQPVLRKRAKAVKHVNDEFKGFVNDMFETMHHANGIGLAANQVGSLVDEKKHEGVGEAATPADVNESQQPKTLVLLNPEVVSSEGAWKMEEGCLSIPEIRDEVERPETIRVAYKDLSLVDREIEASGLLGRVLLHEIDHLNGILFIDRLGLVKRKLLRGRLNKIHKGQVTVNYPVLTADNLESIER
jgi:peptide deformylase